MTSVVTFQKIESLAILVVVFVAYGHFEYSWLWFAILLLTPDISMLGYFKNPRVGAMVYNIGHSYVSPIVLLLVSVYVAPTFGVMYALIWVAHIAMDRVLGFGLKQLTGFKDTHLGALR